MKRKRATPSAPISCLLLLGLFLSPPGCSQESSEPAPESSITDATASDASAPASPLGAQISAAEKLSEAGAVDQAAAELLKIQISGGQFTQQEAAQFRQALAEAYSRALEGAQKGDPRAAAALKMIQAANPR
jgi:hypothetical protein